MPVSGFMSVKTVVLCLNQKKVIVAYFAHMDRCHARQFRRAKTLVAHHRIDIFECPLLAESGLLILNIICYV